MGKRFAAVFLAGALAMAQSFEVVSLKPADPDERGYRVGIAPGGIFQARGVTLKALMEQAYGVMDFQISGSPGWTGTERYDIEGKGNGPAVSEEDLIKLTHEQRNQFQQQMFAKLRALMADRFQLKAHKETKEMPVYALVTVKGGPKIVKTADTFTPKTSLSSRRSPEGKMVVTGTGVPLAYLVRPLSQQVERTVIDKTELTGSFDFKLTFAPGLTDSDGPSIFAALEEQLGLKLESQRGPVEVLVIDSVEHPSPN